MLYLRILATDLIRETAMKGLFAWTNDYYFKSALNFLSQKLMACLLQMPSGKGGIFPAI